jgi:hypothetical protein
MSVLAPLHLRAAPERATRSRLLVAAHRADFRGTAGQPVAPAAGPRQAASPPVLAEALLAPPEALLLLPPALSLPRRAPLLARHLAPARWLARLGR